MSSLAPFFFLNAQIYTNLVIITKPFSSEEDKRDMRLLWRRDEVHLHNMCKKEIK